MQFSHYTDKWLGKKLSKIRKKYERILLKIHNNGTIKMFEQGPLIKLKNESIYEAYERHHKEHLRIVKKYDRYEKMLDKAYYKILQKRINK